MKRSGDSTHPWRSPKLTVNGCDLITRHERKLLNRNKWIDSQLQAAVNTVLQQNSSKFFSRDPVLCFLETEKTRVDAFGVLPKFFKFVTSQKVFCSATARTKTALGILQRWFSYVVASFIKAFGTLFSRRLSKEMSW